MCCSSLDCSIFPYTLVIDADNYCLKLDRSLEIVASILRFFTDLFYILHVVFQFRTAFIAPSFTVVGRGVLVEDTMAIAKRYLSTYFSVDVFAVLPLPQSLELLRINVHSGTSVHTKAVRIIPLYQQITRSAGILTETAWSGAAFNLLIYMLASHVFGTLWHLLALQREDACWKLACSKHNCNPASLYCGAERLGQNNSFLGDTCPTDNTLFDFGIYTNALVNVATDTSFFEKLF